MAATFNGFANDQFFGIGSAGEQDTKIFSWGNLIPPNNPPFIYPAREVLTQDGKGKVTRTKLQRGYIRTLINSVQGTQVGIRKCAFQFNPQILSTSVQMTQDVLNAYQLDVGQFAVPTAGNSNFLFQLFFDRSMELNNGPGPTDNVTGDPNTTNIFSGDGALAPSAIGVFRDIGELNAIIGAGLSAEELVFAQQTAIAQIKAQAISQGTALTDTAVTTAVGNVPGIISSVNYGNTAFLIPQPVRAVFSSLFMVEGFVTNIDINYTKFTTQMVPMQAAVTLTMNAQYIGYAKKKTYVTDSLDNQTAFFDQQQQAAQANLSALVITLQHQLTRASLFVSSTATAKANPTTSIQTLGNVLGNGGTPVYTDAFVSAVGNPTVNGVTGVFAPNSLVDLSTATFSIKGTLNIYGPSASPFPRDITAQTPIRVFTVNQSGVAYSDLVGTDVVTFDPNGNNPQVLSATVSPLSNLPTSRSAGDLDGTKYYSMRWDMTLTAATPDTQNQTAIGTGTLTYNTKDLTVPTFPFNGETVTTIGTSTTHAPLGTMSIAWVAQAPPVTTVATTTTQSKTTPPVVTTPNASTTPPAPGSTSKVGGSNRGGVDT